MLVLKVVSIDENDEEHTSLFFGDSITHVERTMKAIDLPKYPSAQHVGSLLNASSEQPFVASQVLIFNPDRIIKEELLILPKSTCFITESGKTADTFHSYFKQV